MAASTAVIANKALRHLGVASTITTLRTDVTAPGKACQSVLTACIQETLTAHDWACARKQATLTLVETFADSDTKEWDYSYRLPTDCLTPRRILNGVRNPREDQEVPFLVVADTDSTAWDVATTYAAGDYALSASIWYRALRTTVGDTPASSTSDWVAITGGPPMLLWTDQEDAILEYTMDLTDVTRFDLPLESAIAALMAFYVAPSVTVNDSAVNLSEKVAGLWEFLVNEAKKKDYNARKRDIPPFSGYRSARFRGAR